MSREKKEAPTGAATSAGAKTEAETEQTTTSNFKFSTGGARGQRVSDFLRTGKGNAITGKELLPLLGLHDLRDLTQQVELERKALIPICASTDTRCSGYYLPADESELSEYISSLDRRIRNMSTTRVHCEDALLAMTGQTRLDWFGGDDTAGETDCGGGGEIL